MKRLVAVFAVVVLSVMTALPASAQEYQLPQIESGKRVKVGVGGLSFPDVIGIFVTALGSIDFKDDTYYSELTPLTNISVEMLYEQSDWFSLGWSVAMGYSSGSVVTTGGETYKKTQMLYPTVSFVAETRYFEDEEFVMYGAWGVGATIYLTHQDFFGRENNIFGATVLPSVDLYPAGFRWGENIGAQIEVGWGSKGVVNCGLFFNF